MRERGLNLGVEYGSVVTALLSGLKPHITISSRKLIIRYSISATSKENLLLTGVDPSTFLEGPLVTAP